MSTYIVQDQKSAQHGVVAPPWMIKAAQEGRLGAIIVPYDEALLTEEGRWDYHEHIRKEPTVIPFEVGDHIYLQEEWKRAYLELAGDEGYFSFQRKSQYPDSNNTDWQPAENMPPEAAQHWYAIVGVQVEQLPLLHSGLHEASGHSRSVAGKTSSEIWNIVRECYERWDEAYPEYLSATDPWVIVLSVKAISEAARVFIEAFENNLSSKNSDNDVRAGS